MTELEIADEQIEILRGEWHKLRDKNLEQYKEIIRLRKERTHSAGERDRLRAELEEYKAEIDRVRDTYDLEDELATVTTKRDQLKAKLDTCSEAMAHETALLDKALAERDKLKGENQKLMNSANYWKENAAAWRGDCDQLRKALMAYRKAQRAMLDKWAEGDAEVKRDLWQNLHACEDAANRALEVSHAKGAEVRSKTAERLYHALDTLFGHPPIYVGTTDGDDSGHVWLVLTEEQAEQIATDYERMTE